GTSVLGSSVSLPQVVHDPPRYSADNGLVKGLLTAMHHPSRLFPSRNGRRLRWRYEHDGFDGLFDHRHRTPSPRRAPVAEVQRVVRLYAERYHGFNAIYASVRSLSSSRSQADLTRAILTRADFGVLSVSTALRREMCPAPPVGFATQRAVRTPRVTDVFAVSV